MDIEDVMRQRDSISDIMMILSDIIEEEEDKESDSEFELENMSILNDAGDYLGEAYECLQELCGRLYQSGGFTNE